MGKRHWTLAVLTVAALLAGLLGGCSGGSSQEEATPTPIPTAVVPSKPTYTVQRGHIAEQVKFSGRIAAVEEDQLFFKNDGRVATVNVKQGDTVKKGDILAELEMSDLLNQLAQAKVTLETAQTRLNSSQSNTDEARTRSEIDLEVAKLRLQEAQLQDPQADIEIAGYRVEQAKNSLWSAQVHRDAACGQGQGADCDSAQASVQSAEQALSISQKQYEETQKSAQTHDIDLKILEQDVKLAELNLSQVGVDVDPTMSQDVAKAQLAVDRLEAQVADGRLVAPFDGEITMVGAYAGRTVTAYKPVVNIAAPGALEISADLTSDTMAKLSIGQPCSIEIVNYPAQEFHGSVRRLPYPYGTGGSTTTTGTTEEDRSTRISLDDAGDVELEKGALVRVTVTLQEKDDVLWLPPEAIRTFQGKDFVLVMDGEGQRRVPVTVGIKAEDRVEILSGVEEGQVIVGP